MSTEDDLTEGEGAEREPPPQPSRSELRSEAVAYADLADELARGKHHELPDPPFDDALRQAIQQAQKQTKSARSRQIRRVAQLLRAAAPLAELRDALAGRTPTARAMQSRERDNEAWRARLLAEGDGALSEFVAAYPDADRKRLRQLMRQANRRPPDPRSKRAATSLIREIRAVSEAARVLAE